MGGGPLVTAGATSFAFVANGCMYVCHAAAAASGDRFACAPRSGSLGLRATVAQRAAQTEIEPRSELTPKDVWRRPRVPRSHRRASWMCARNPHPTASAHTQRLPANRRPARSPCATDRVSQNLWRSDGLHTNYTPTHICARHGSRDQRSGSIGGRRTAHVVPKGNVALASLYASPRFCWTAEERGSTAARALTMKQNATRSKGSAEKGRNMVAGGGGDLGESGHSAFGFKALRET